MTGQTLKVYDSHFNANEYTVLFGLCLGLILVFVLPRRFSAQVSILFFMCGVTFGFLFDHVLSVIPVSFYDVNDSSKFEFMDFVSYWMYGPVSYIFYYLFDLFRVPLKFSAFYILCSALISTCIEWGTDKVGIFHYHHGYGLGVSFEIYLLVHSVWVCFYYFMKRANLMSK